MFPVFYLSLIFILVDHDQKQPGEEKVYFTLQPRGQHERKLGKELKVGTGGRN